MIFTKLIAPIALLLTVSAAEWESVCVDGDKALLLANNHYQDAVCLTIPLSQARDQWGGGTSWCNAGTYRAYWNIASDGQVWLCYGKMSACKAIKANQDQRLAESKGYDNCWSAQV